MSTSSSTNRFNLSPRQQDDDVESPAPKTKFRRRPPVNLQPGDLWLFKHELEHEIHRPELLEFEDVGVSSDGFLFKGGKILPESFVVPSHLWNWKKRSVFKFLVSNYLLKKRRRFTPAAAWIVDNWSHAYYHWFADALPRLFLIRDRLADLVLLLPSHYEKLGFVHQSLAPFGVKKLEFINPGEALLCRRLVVPMHAALTGNHNEEVVREIRALLVGAYAGRPDELSTRERIYISRGKAPIRRIKNEEAVIEILREFDFELIHFEDYPFEEQVRIASRARYLVSSHGAGLTNMLFMSAGNNILELRNKTDWVDNCYFNLASALNLNYFYQTCEAEDPDEDPHSANLLVDTQALRENLKLMLDS